jgi:hydroxymethylbilane synthase
LRRPTLKLATRGSPLALQQSRWVQAELERLAPGLRVELLVLSTTGDHIRSVPLPAIGGKGLFTKELEDALQGGRAHCAVHSLKDLPTDLPSGLTLACVPRREDTRDVWVSRDGVPLTGLPPRVRVGTSSLRRAAQLKRIRPDIEIVPLRGNLGTRLRKLHEEKAEGDMAAIVVAAAGMHRMGFSDQITEYFSPETLCPAVGQGALGIEARASDTETMTLLAHLEDSWARVTATAERALLRHLGGGCQVPIAASATRQGDRLALAALVIRPDGGEVVQTTEVGPPGEASLAGEDAVRMAERLGRAAAQHLLELGAARILESIPEQPSPFSTSHTP